jgi:hypothetical protein
MLGKLFRRRKPEPANESASEALAIDPELYARARAAADLIGPGVMAIATGERGVHVESMLVALGAVAGYGCQVAARLAPPEAVLADPGKTPWAQVTGADGRTYFFGDAVNHYLLEAPASFWGVAAGIIGQRSARPVPDPFEIVRHVAETVGGAGFGAIRFPPGTSAAHSPWEYLGALWPDVRDRLDESGLAPGDWPLGFGIAAQIALFAAQEVIEPTVALAMLMETAVAMAKVDPAALGLRAD